MIFYIIALSVIIFFILFLFWSLINWFKIEDESSNKIVTGNIKVAVIVPVRNEANNLPALLKSLMVQKYPPENFQIIISDDHSTDNSIQIAEDFVRQNKLTNARCLVSPGLSKKEALTYAISNTESELILTTDADTIIGEEWISAMTMKYTQSNSYLICGPVKLIGENTFMDRLQTADFTGLMGIGASGIISGRPMFCNGANLAFPKRIFTEVGGYGNSKSSSGDDTQLMLKIHRSYPGKISFLKDSRAVIQTNVVKGNADILSQRKRWASKIPTTLSGFTIFISVIVWFVHVFMLILLLKSLLQLEFLQLLLPFVMIVITELIFLKSVGKFFNVDIPWWLIILVQPVYWTYIVFVGLFAPLSSYRWKGRKLR